ncbi:MAG: acetate--CoA ligase family protein [Deltaproteobacteria bacterium]|nr:acetate--CoA ligase family protein [Deltaproteobacteria bacterium]MBW1923716.1 acetate--CoA ligase family protein [Deltaproteobacteria bacterium]MBW1950528.1 acetate--CoA ligase family protein [Deltaproteobacteria bacterium]MBW2008489.1 acetate--CoA ligase family protein [Deltaproteobacteria bacterium]MBW2103804.1 acetate--CoA ligase family protein [Deltaproteobacteria bacterium]
MDIIEKALADGRKTLSEYESKQVLAAYEIPVTREELVENEQDLVRAADDIGYPLVLKGCSADIAHKTEKGLIRVDVRSEEEAKTAFGEIMGAMEGDKGAVLVQEMVKGQRELVVGLIRDPQFGPCVMFGLGGIFTEILKDVSFRIVPFEKRDALEMMQEIKARKILEAVRGMEAADVDALAHILLQVGKIGEENDRVKEIDINPVILSGAKPVAVDALVVLE